MTKIFLVVSFVLTMLTLTFAAASAGTPNAPATMVIQGQVMDVDYN